MKIVYKYNSYWKNKNYMLKLPQLEFMKRYTFL